MSFSRIVFPITTLQKISEEPGKKRGIVIECFPRSGIGGAIITVKTGFVESTMNGIVEREVQQNPKKFSLSCNSWLTRKSRHVIRAISTGDKFP